MSLDGAALQNAGGAGKLQKQAGWSALALWLYDWLYDNSVV
jgi:hypothetical protein